jgi:Icc-related predicted phosphoesterase
MCYGVSVRLGLVSDLHVDHHDVVTPLIKRARELALEALIVPGDVTGDLDRLEEVLQKLRQSVPRLLFVPGNHDLWCEQTGPDSRQRYEEAIPERVRRAGCEPLCEVVRLGDFECVGVTGWFDYSLRNRALDDRISMEDYRRGAFGRLRWNDKHHIRWSSLDDEEICAEQAVRLSRLLSQTTRRVIVVTHHLPFAELVTLHEMMPFAFISGFLGSARLGEVIRSCERVTWSFSGHSHLRRSATVDGLRAEVSPVGYPREYRPNSIEERVADRLTIVDV